MWKWPALGLTIVMVCFLINMGLWVNALPTANKQPVIASGVNCQYDPNNDPPQ